jgi:hypothetical protein
MITIKLRFDKEDLQKMERSAHFCMECLDDSLFDRMIKDVLWDLLLKLHSACAHNGEIVLNTAELFVFSHIFETYSKLGVYEENQARLISEVIERKFTKKFNKKYE